MSEEEQEESAQTGAVNRNFDHTSVQTLTKIRMAAISPLHLLSKYERYHFIL